MMDDRVRVDDKAALKRTQTIAEELRDIDERLRGATSSEVMLTLVDSATELAEEAARLLEQVGRAQS